jgi:putative ABC transport system permease protein
VFLLAWKNLVKEPTRVALTLVGVTFAVVLIFFDLGAYFGFVKAFSLLIDRSQADIWVTLQNNVNFDSSRPFPESKLWRVRQVQGVDWAEPVAKGWSLIKLRNGGTDTVMVVGINPDSRIGWPWKMKEGSLRDLRVDNTLILDESAVGKLGALRVGDRVEVFDTRVTIVGLSQEVRTFTSYPIAFANYETAKRLAVVYRAGNEDQTTFILAKVKPGAAVDAVMDRLRGIKGVDVYSRETFSWHTRKYWIVQTGVGVGFGVTALLGFLVGMIIVGQTIYASTLEHLREFGTLKALGATNRELVSIIMYQAALNALAGYALGLLIAVTLQQGYERLGLNLVSTWWLRLSMFGVTLVMCLSAAVLPMRKAFNVDPVTVFRT